MKKEELIKGNILIADFLDWHQFNTSTSDDYIPMYKVPKNLNDLISVDIDMSVEEFLFDSDWNWLMHCWDMLHRKVLIPISKNNPHLRRELNDMINDMRSCLKWSHIEGAYKVLVKIITWYNNQFE